MNLNAYKALNKTIWFYWDAGLENAPRFVQTCILSWKVMNPDWQVVVISKQNINEYIDLKVHFGRDLDELPVQAYSDILRVSLLATRGGVWCDATLVCKKALKSWLPMVLQSGFFCFHRPVPGREIASWFLVAQSGEGLIAEWFTFLKAFWTNKRKQVVKVQNEITGYGEPPYSNEFWLNSDKVPYFWLHYSFAFLVQSSTEFAHHWECTPKVTANLPHAFAIFHFLRSTDRCTEMESEWQNGLAPLYKGTYKYIDYEAGQGRRRSPMGYLQSSALSYISDIYTSIPVKERPLLNTSEQLLINISRNAAGELSVDKLNAAIGQHYALMRHFEKGNLVEFERALQATAHSELPGFAKPLYVVFHQALKGGIFDAAQKMAAFIEQAEYVEGLEHSLCKHWFDFMASLDQTSQVKLLDLVKPTTISVLLDAYNQWVQISEQNINFLLSEMAKVRDLKQSKEITL